MKKVIAREEEGEGLYFRTTATRKGSQMCQEEELIEESKESQEDEGAAQP